MVTAGLTDYEVRDLNDEINKLMREKRHWENQIVALGGANYRRNVAMLDDDGKEVPGTKGYKSVSPMQFISETLANISYLFWIYRYFGRAKDLPGVRELFQSRKHEEEEENQALAHYKKFMNQGPAYYGDLDEADGKLLQFEREAEEEGTFNDILLVNFSYSNFCLRTTVPGTYRLGRSLLQSTGSFGSSG